MMDLDKRVRAERRDLCLRAHDRWMGSQPAAPAPRAAEAIRDITARRAAGAARDIAPPRAAADARDIAPPSAAEGLPTETLPRAPIGTITPEQRGQFEERQRLRAVFDSTAYRNLRVTAERQIGATLDFVDLPPNEQALKAGRPVVRIVTLPGAGLVPQGFATGFLIAPELVITNYHVFRTLDEARGVGAQFLYERAPGGLREGVIFEFDPDRFFINDQGLDYAVVAVKVTSLDGAALNQFRYLPLIGVTGKIRKGDPVNIIEHPNGGPKQYATVNNRLLDLREDGFLLYETDTLEGSSGSPVFSQYWETIGLHHCGVPKMENGMLVKTDGQRVPLDAEVADSDLIWIANEGVRVSALVASLSQQQMPRPEQQRILADLLEHTRDPLRTVVEQSPLITPATDDVSNPDERMRTDMAQNLFQFSGPVTIQVTTSSVTVPGVDLNTSAHPTPAPEAPAEFREKTLKFDEDYKLRTKHGYKPTFLSGWRIPAPTLNPQHSGAPLKNAQNKVWMIPYYHYSLVMNRDRRLLAWAASNVDYSDGARKYTKNRKDYGGENWRLDPRVALEAPGLQIEDADFYAPAKKIDRGHIVRREDGAWGASAQEAEYGNSDTYHWTNCTPQSEAFNQSGKDGIWGKFEEHIQAEVGAVGGRMVVFAGPVLNPADPEHGYQNGSTIRVPMEFWKLVMCVSLENGKKVKLAYGFVFDQTEPVQRLGFERMNMDDYAVYQMPITAITKKTGVVFDKSVLAADVLKPAGAPESIRGFRGKRIQTLESVVLR